jgi:ATP-dependent Clp protease ATP-binding subunit ClpC
VNGMFTERVKRVMQLAREESVRLGTDYVGTEHLLLGLLKEGEGVAITAMRNLQVDLEELGREIERAIAPSGTSSLMTIGQMIPFTPRAKRVLEVAAQEARSMSHKYIGTEHLLLALIKDQDSAAANSLANLGLEYDRVREEIDRILNGGQEAAGATPAPGTGPTAPGGDPKKKSKTPFLDHFGRDLTELAREGSLDPIIGRGPEIERIIQILSRRKKNNPVLIGDPGVGKTAIVEGLAQAIVEKRIPEILENKRVVVLDMANIVAGTKYRGQFEERLKALMAELQKNRDVIIFIDELHTIVGAGGSEGSLDASNIFKPALARGELQCIGATTLDEYRKYIEKDGALERRFQTILVDPPSPEETVEIIKGLRGKYETHHKVTYTDKAVEQAVQLSERYITDRSLPDKALDIIDEAGARVRLASMEIPPELRAKEDRLVEVAALKESSVEHQNYETAARLRDEQDSLKKEIEDLKRDWRERKKVERLVVDIDEVRDVVSCMTGVPLSRINTANAQRLLNLELELRGRVIGQEQAIVAISKAVRRARAGVHNARKPMGSFMFLGPTGVGKTELVKALANLLFGSDDAMIRIDMSEYMEKFNVSRLIGAPPGYVGYDDQGGQLTERVRKRPYSVVLFDEIEKAHPDVFNIMLQILDDGQITDSHGRKVNFKNTLIIMTSNAGAKFMRKGTGMGFAKSNEDTEHERLETSIKEEVKRIFNPEFINRIDDMIIFRALTKENLRLIVDLLMNDLQKRIKDKKVTLELTDEARDLILKEGYDPMLGARPLRRAIQRLVEDNLAEGFLDETIADNSHVLVDASRGEIVLQATANAVDEDSRPELLLEKTDSPTDTESAHS